MQSVTQAGTHGPGGRYLLPVYENDPRLGKYKLKPVGGYLYTQHPAQILGIKKAAAAAIFVFIFSGGSFLFIWYYLLSFFPQGLYYWIYWFYYWCFYLHLFVPILNPTLTQVIYSIFLTSVCFSRGIS